MQVILQKNVTHVGLVGDLVEVAPGFYRNFLAPRNLALIANPSSLKQLEHQKKIIEAKKTKEKATSEALKENLQKAEIKIAHTAGSGGKLFGSVTSQEIAHGLMAKGFDIDRKLIKLQDPIKNVGNYTVEIKLHPEVVAEVQIEVIQKAGPSEGPAKKAKASTKKSKAKSEKVEAKEEKSEV